MSDYDLVEFVRFVTDKKAHSLRVFGPNKTSASILTHLRKELIEVEEDPQDLEEWIDVVLLGLDGAWRAGHSPEEIVNGLVNKFKIIQERKWPDWRTLAPDQHPSHIKDTSNVD